MTQPVRQFRDDHTARPPPPGLAPRLLGSPPARVPGLGFVLLLMMGLNGDVTGSYGGEPVKATQHIIALAIAGFAVYVAHARFIERRTVDELSGRRMGREFGLTHLINPQATLEGALFIAVEAGILLAAAFMPTRQLWLSIGFHMAWNRTRSAIFRASSPETMPRRD